MKWFLIGSVCLLCSANWAKGDPMVDLYNSGVSAMQNGQYDQAGQLFDKFIANYARYPALNEVRIRAGYAYWRAGKFAEAIDRLSKATAATAKPEDRATALYFTGLAQFAAAQKSTDKNQANHIFNQAVATLTTLIDLITKAPTADNKAYLEEALYNRASAYYLRENYNAAENDLIRLTQEFSASLSRPDYLLRLGSIYAVQAQQAVTAKKQAGDVRTLADKALDAFDQVSRDPNALVQANEANMDKAEVLFLIAPLDATSAGYEKALEAFRLVGRKADMIKKQQGRLDDLKKQLQAQLQNSAASMSNDDSLLISREETRLNELTSAPDPIIQALIRMAECYICMKQPDEARTILHRLIAHATLTPDQQKEVDFQTLYSYVLGGQTNQADKALDNYLSKHAGDPLADSISYQIAVSLLGRKDYDGALHQAQRSLKDFPPGKGRYAADAITLEAQVLAQLGRTEESNDVIQKFLEANPTGPEAAKVLLTRGQNEAGVGNFDAALADYGKVKDDSSAGPGLQGTADIQYIQTLNALHRFDDVISEVKSFESQYPDRKELPSMLLLAALAMDQKHDPGEVAALQDIARKFPKDDAAPRALYSVVTIYQRANNMPAMIQAAKDLSQACPDAYAFLAPAAYVASGVLVKEGKFDEAIALYQPLADAPKPEVAAAALNKIGGIGLAAAHEMGAGAEGEKRLSAAEQAYLKTLENFSDQLNAVGDAFDGLADAARQRRAWGLLQDADLEGYLGKLGIDLITPEMEARLELAKAGLVFVYKNGAGQYPAALDRFKKVIEMNPDLRLTPQETAQYGELLLAAKDYPTALKVYGDLLNDAGATDPMAQGNAYYGMGTAYLAQGDSANAKSYFLKIKALPGGGLWHPHILDADYGIAFADEQSGQPADVAEAAQIYSQLMQNQRSSTTLLAEAMLGYGRLLEKSGNALKPAAGGPTEYAIHYYKEPDLLFGPAAPELSAEGLFYAGQGYEKAGDNANAKKEYDALLKNYGTTAPDWAAKTQVAEDHLPP